MTRTRTIILTQNETLMREAMGERIYRKICDACHVGVRARSANKRKCPPCGGRLRAATNDEAATDTFQG